MRARKNHSRQRGGTLITALAFAVIISTVLAGAGTLAVGHFSRAQVESDYATAIALADAGVNHEVWFINEQLTDEANFVELDELLLHMDPPETAHGNFGPYTGTISGVPGSFTVYVKDVGTTVGGDFTIVSTGTVNGIARTVHVRGKKKSIFDEYALFAYEEGTFSGGGASATSTNVVGNLGTNGDLTFNGTMNSMIVDPGDVILNGDGAEMDSGDDAGNVVTEPDPVPLPTVTQIADATFPGGGLSWLANNNDNAKIRTFQSANTAMAGISLPADLTLGNYESHTSSAGFTAASRTLGSPGNSVPASSSSLDNASSGTRFVNRTLTVTNGAVSFGAVFEGVQGLRTWILPPGDYYFTRVDLKSGNGALLILNHLGRVRIWIDEGSNQADSLSNVVVFTSTDPTKFRLYYNKCDTLTIAGNSNFYGGLYGIKDGCTGTPDFKFTGNSTVYGSVMTQVFTLSGGTRVVFPNDGVGADDDFYLRFGIQPGWREVAATGNAIFADGTSK